MLKKCHPEGAKRPKDLMFLGKGFFASLRMTILLFLTASIPAYAQEQEAQKTEEEAIKEDGFLYAPEACDFEITFPDKFYTRRRCPEDAGPCYNLTSYTVVYKNKATLDISVSCNAIDPRTYDQYENRMMRNIMRGMIARKNINRPTINFTEDELYKQASVSGKKGKGRNFKSYEAQIWVGENSLLTIEANRSGSSKDAFETTRSIMDSINPQELEDLDSITPSAR